MSKNTQSFRTDSPDQFIEKMESTMSKKRKNNFKNIEELENIYDEKNETKNPGNSSDKDSIEPGEITEAFDELEKSMEYMIKSISPMTKGMTKRNQKNKKLEEEEEEDEDIIEGFSSNYTDNYTSIYKPEYEYDKMRTRIGPKEYAEMAKDAKAGLLDTTKLKELLNTGEITQSQYNKLFGFYLDFSGFNWKNADTQPQNKQRCPKWNKDCGGNGPDIIEYIRRLISYFKQLTGLYSQLLRYLSTVLYKSTDGKLDGKPSNNSADVSVIVNVLHFLIMIPLSIYFSYNWFYITFYRDENNQPIKIDFSNDIMGSLKGLLIRFFRSLVQPMILLDSFLRLVIPTGYYKNVNTLKTLVLGPLDFSFIGKILANPMFIFISLTLIILGMTCSYSDTVANMLYAYMGDAKIPYGFFLYGIIIYDLIIGIASVGTVGLILGVAETIASPLSSLFWFLVLVIFSLLMIRFAGIFVILYLYVISYFALSIYSPGDMNTAIKSIHLAFEASIKDTDNKCPKGKWEKIILNILNLIYKYLFALLYIIVMSYSTFLIFSTMKSSSGKIILGSTLVMIIAIIIMTIALISLQSGQSVSKSDIDI